ncbi:TDT family transporter [Oceanisphaera sp. IT1-181]|uniref:TDT family transporter n=1 Tax=Oceanisphaera sp. IT1-181 TaxID=3081199 RepID=UPI0029C9BC04|nr:TDT family transporter [Oceanisphaera sp. IT1-181]
MLNISRHRFANVPTPMAGLALGIASLGWAWENVGLFSGGAQMLGAIIAAVLLLILTAKFVLHPQLLMQDLAHPVVGSVVPTFAMATMVVSKALGGSLGTGLWLFAIALHLVFLVTFIWHRLKGFKLHQMVPSWFVPPIGIIVADVASPGGAFAPLAQVLLWFGIVCYAVMLPMMLYRLIFCAEVPDAAKPTIAIMAAPASLSLAGYLTVTEQPAPVLVAVLLGIAVLMTALIYLAFIKLLRLPFSPGYAAFTFPMVIGATALFKVATLAETLGLDAATINQLRWMAEGELVIATLVVSYVALRFAQNFNPLRKALADLA